MAQSNRRGNDFGRLVVVRFTLANIKDRALSKVCRSTNATTGSTVIDIDLGQARSLRHWHCKITTLASRVAGASSLAPLPAPAMSTAAAIKRRGFEL